MRSKFGLKLLDSFKLRLALLTAGIFMLATLISFTYLYRSLSIALDDRIDESLRTEVKEFTDIFRAGGLDALRNEVAFEEAANGKDDVFMRILDGDGNVLITSDVSSWDRALLDSPIANDPPIQEFELRTLRVAGAGNNARFIVGLLGPGTVVQMGYTLRENATLLREFRARFREVLSVMLGLCALGAWVIAKRAMYGVESIAQTARQIAAGDLGRRVHVAGQGFEIDRLAATFNMMLDRIEALVLEIKQISDNVAHELRSPITRIRGNAEVTLLGDATRDDYRELTGSIIEECDGLLSLVNIMLDISELEGGVAKITLDRMDISELLRDTCELFLPAAEDLEVTLTAEAGEAAIILGDRRILGQAFVNLLDNAMKYTARGGVIAASVTQTCGQVRITIRDTGIGIPPEDIPHIFDRFYRGSNGQSMPGTGLGLGLVKAVIGSHGGSIRVSSTLNRGTTFDVVIPTVEARA